MLENLPEDILELISTFTYIPPLNKSVVLSSSRKINLVKQWIQCVSECKHEYDDIDETEISKTWILYSKRLNNYKIDVDLFMKAMKDKLKDMWFINRILIVLPKNRLLPANFTIPLEVTN